MATVEVNIGGPAPLNITGARRGSRWFMPLAFDGVDLSTVTAATAVLKQRPGNDNVDPSLEFTVDLSQVASDVITISATREGTLEVPAGDYLWELELTASDEEIDGWAPLSGSWPVVERIAERTEGS